MTIDERKIALVFGGARGIGAAAVERLSKTATMSPSHMFRDRTAHRRS